MLAQAQPKAGRVLRCGNLIRTSEWSRSRSFALPSKSWLAKATCHLQSSDSQLLFGELQSYSTLSASDGRLESCEVTPGSSAASTTRSPLSAYLHLPFCKRRCYYCDFPIQAVGSNANSPAVRDTMQAYVDVLCREIKASRPLGNRHLETVYFGGGTPSLIPPAMLQQILETLAVHFGSEMPLLTGCRRIAEGAEVTLEADPGTFTRDSLLEYMSLGVSRLSVGIQAFDEEVLAGCGRSHSLADVFRAIEDVKACEIGKWSLDLISGLPHSTLESWRSSLRMALDAQPTHISVYDLQVEEKTKFGSWYAPGQAPLPGDETAAAMFCAASDMLRAGGFEHYEISSFARPGHRSKHNSTYWTGAPYYAFGLGAASYLDDRRFSRPKSMLAYKRWVEGFEARGDGIPGLEEASEGTEERLLDAVMLRLRLSDGLDFRDLARDFGARAAAVAESALRTHVKRGLAEPTPDGAGVRLRDPEGFLVSNDIISDVFAAIDAANLHFDGQGP